ncbi:MAG: hypothetical protein C6I00_03335 [Nitratiruptor sp.]|nr:hypothetical protein [Nitratiruptor sp.]NPA83132.1 prepilin-type N-terminal cleavage/methylation domain-containing protein [Campylobacterota bacterium]
MQHRAFTLIEVVIAVMILALVGVALLRSGGENATLLQRVETKGRMSEYIALVAAHRNPTWNRLSKRLEDFLGLNVLDDELRHLLKSSFRYQEQEVKITMPTLTEFNQSQEEPEERYENPLGLSLIKVSIQNEDGGDYLYLLEMP